MTLLKVGVKHPDVLTLRDALAVHGLTAPVTVMDPSYFDEGLRQLVMQFQKLMGIDVDGVVGPQTWGKLTVSTAATSVAVAHPGVTGQPIPAGPMKAASPSKMHIILGVLALGGLALFLSTSSTQFAGYSRRKRRRSLRRSRNR